MIIDFPSNRVQRIDPVIMQTVREYMTDEKFPIDNKEHKRVLYQHCNSIDNIWPFLDYTTKKKMKRCIRENKNNPTYSIFKKLLDKEI